MQSWQTLEHLSETQPVSQSKRKNAKQRIYSFAIYIIASRPISVNRKSGKKGYFNKKEVTIFVKDNLLKNHNLLNSFVALHSIEKLHHPLFAKGSYYFVIYIVTESMRVVNTKMDFSVTFITFL